MTIFVRNYIDESERRFLEDSYVSSLGDLWSTDETIEADAIVFQDSRFGSLRASGASEVNVYYNIWGSPSTDVPSQFAVTSVDDFEDVVESFVWVKPTEECTVYLKTVITKAIYEPSTQKYMLSTNPLDVIEGEFGELAVRYGFNDSAKWHLVRAGKVVVPSAVGSERYSIGLQIRIVYSSEVGETNISQPSITMLNDLFVNPFAMGVFASLPDVFLLQDFARNDNSVSFPLLRLIEVATSVAGEVEEKFETIQYLDSESNFDPNEDATYSTLISPRMAETLDNLRWLSHFRGRELLVTYEPSTEGEEWQEFILDSSSLDGTGVLASNTIPTSGISGGVDAYFRWQIETGYYGHNAGTIDAMISAIQLLLSDTKSVTYTLALNQITFQTKLGETFASDALGFEVGDSNPFIVQILEPARPLGLLAIHELVA